MSAVKNSLDGSGRHMCSGKSTQQAMSMRGVVHLKMNLKTVFKKHDTHRQGAAGNGDIEMTDFNGSPNDEQSILTEVFIVI